MANPPLGGLSEPPLRPSQAMGRGRTRRARLATASIFFQQGFLVGGWALQIPFVLDRLGITESIMGLIIVAFGTGSIIAMLAIGPILTHQGSRGVLRFVAVTGSPALFILAVTPDVWTTAIAAFLAGASIGCTDVSMNAQGLEVEHRLRRPIMSSLHGFWSVGTLTGAAISGAIIAAIGPVGHAALFSVVCFLVAVVAWPHFVRERRTAADASTPFSFPRAPVVWLLGLVTLFAFVPEGAVIDWSALMMREEIAVPITAAGLGLAGLQVTMTIMRFMGDSIRARIGPVATLRWGGLLGGLGLLIVGAAASELAAELPVTVRTVLTVLGFLVMGTGLANIVPVAFAAAGEVPGVPSGPALSIIATSGYAGILLAPSALGWIGEHTGFAAVFAGLAAMPLVTAALARVGDPRSSAGRG